jgi:hypothetical protein
MATAGNTVVKRKLGNWQEASYNTQVKVQQQKTTVLAEQKSEIFLGRRTVRLLFRKSRISWYQNRPKDFSS